MGCGSSTSAPLPAGTRSSPPKNGRVGGGSGTCGSPKVEQRQRGGEVQSGPPSLVGKEEVEGELEGEGDAVEDKAAAERGVQAAQQMNQFLLSRQSTMQSLTRNSLLTLSLHHRMSAQWEAGEQQQQQQQEEQERDRRITEWVDNTFVEGVDADAVLRQCGAAAGRLERSVTAPGIPQGNRIREGGGARAAPAAGEHNVSHGDLGVFHRPRAAARS